MSIRLISLGLGFDSKQARLQGIFAYRLPHVFALN